MCLVQNTYSLFLEAFCELLGLGVERRLPFFEQVYCGLLDP